MREVMRRKVSAELWVSHQIANALQHIALGIKAKLLGRYLVAPFNTALLIQQHHAVGAGLQSRQNIIQALIALMHLLLALANPAAHTHTGLAPDARQIRRSAQL